MCSDRLIAGLLFCVLLVAYHLNGGFLPEGDACPNLWLVERLLQRGDLTLPATEIPDMLRWRLHAPGGSREVRIRYIDDDIARLIETGVLTDEGSDYLVVPTGHAGRYANTFGLGAALTAAPFFALLHFCADSRVEPAALLWYGGKLVASLCVAGSAVFVYATARLFVGRLFALLVAAAYGLGTCVWAVSSQALWQHGPNELFLAIGTYGLCRSAEGRRFVALCAAGYAAATFCRPTSAAIVFVAGLYYLWYDRRSLALFAAAGMPFGLALAAYHWYLYGSPFAFGQLHLHELAMQKTGSPEIWQTPLWKGALGQLFSPSRGLFVFSPFLAFSLWGGCVAFGQPVFRALRPIALGILGMWGIEFSHFDWWGGFAYGYRHIVDTAPLLALLLVPVIERIVRHRCLLASFSGMLAWSVFVQILGAWAYDMSGWNDRQAIAVELPGRPQPLVALNEQQAERWLREPGAIRRERRLNVDLPENRSRLWSLEDSQILYSITHWARARHDKHLQATYLLESSQLRAADTWHKLGEAWLLLGEFARAKLGFEFTLAMNPADLEARVGLSQALMGLGDDAAAREQLTAAIERSGHEARLRWHLGLAWLVSGRLFEAMAELDAAISLETGQSTASYGSIRQEWNTRLPGAMDAVRDIVAQADTMVAHSWAAQRAVNSMDWQAAECQLQALRELEPRLPLLPARLALLRQCQRRWREAAELAAGGLESQAGSAALYDSLGVSLIHLGQVSEAEDAFAMAERLDPRNASAGRHLRVCRESLR